MREKMQISAIPSLSNSTLPKLPSGVKIPNYDRNNLTAGIVHIGLGNFHRAHQSCLLYTSPSPRDGLLSRMPSSA